MHCADRFSQANGPLAYLRDLGVTVVVVEPGRSVGEASAQSARDTGGNQIRWGRGLKAKTDLSVTQISERVRRASGLLQACGS